LLLLASCCCRLLLLGRLTNLLLRAGCLVRLTCLLLSACCLLLPSFCSGLLLLLRPLRTYYGVRALALLSVCPKRGA
jgi:hypothetical protein